MTPAEVATILRATGGSLTQTAWREHTGNFQCALYWLDSLGLTARQATGRRNPTRILAVSVADALAVIAAQDCAAIPTRAVLHTQGPTRRRGQGKRATAATGDTARHWGVRHDPEERFRPTARFGITELRGPNGRAQEWLVVGMLFEHDDTGEQLRVIRDARGRLKLEHV